MSRIVLLPGLGADARLFWREREHFPGLESPPWITPLPKEPLAQYAGRMADTIAPYPDLLGGVSFGGMVACEMARRVAPRAVVLIGSARSREGLAPLLRHVGPAAGRLPRLVWSAIARAAVLPTVWIEHLGTQEARLFRAMLRDTSPGFLRWASGAILDWRPASAPACPVFQIHGEEDHILPLRLASADRVVAGARHLISLSHPREVNAYLKEIIERLGAPGGPLSLP